MRCRSLLGIELLSIQCNYAQWLRLSAPKTSQIEKAQQLSITFSSGIYSALLPRVTLTFSDNSFVHFGPHFQEIYFP